jgi:hypothetical protein
MASATDPQPGSDTKAMTAESQRGEPSKRQSQTAAGSWSCSAQARRISENDSDQRI